jgi:hypothetical protein
MSGEQLANTTGRVDKFTDREKLTFYVDLFKFYLDLMLKVDVFVAAVVGGIMAFAVTNTQETSVPTRLGFYLVPAGLSFTLGLVALRHIGSAKEMHEEVYRLGRLLDLNPPPHVGLLVDVTVISTVAYFALSAGVLAVAALSTFAK